jgi:hypothetical protein
MKEWSLLLFLASVAGDAARTVPWTTFRIDCVDAETGAGVPLVRVTTSGYINFYSDSAGVVAFDEPGLVGLDVYFVVQSDGYVVNPSSQLPGEPGSEPGVLLQTVAGGNATILLRRTQHAQRLFRLTGGGLYRDTMLVGASPPIAEPLLSSAGVLGQDSLVATTYKGKVFWFFGDTECPAGPRDTDCQHYGRFTTGATSPVDGANPPSLRYFVSTDASAPGGMASDGLPDPALLKRWNPRGFAHPRAMLAGPGEPPLFNMSTWVGSLTVLTDEVEVEVAAEAATLVDLDGTAEQEVKRVREERMYLTYVCPNGGPDRLYGVARWDDTAQLFQPVPGAGYKMRYSGAQTVQLQRPPAPTPPLGVGAGTPSRESHIYYASAYAMSRVPASFASVENPADYEYFTPCVAEEAGGCAASRNLSAASWGWRKAALDGGAGGHAYFGPAQEAALLKAGHLQARDARMQVVDARTQLPIPGNLARGSVNWNAHRGAYVLVANRHTPSSDPQLPADGSSRFGEVYFCEAPAVEGPWKQCVTVATHNITGSWTLKADMHEQGCSGSLWSLGSSDLAYDTQGVMCCVCAMWLLCCEMERW